MWPLFLCPSRPECQALGLTVLVDARRCSPVPALFKAFSILQVSLELGQRNTSWLAVLVACYISICCLCLHLPPGFSWLWEVELYTQPCFRRMTWTCQTADKAKSLSKSALGENTPPHPSKFASVSAEQPVPQSKGYCAWRCCPLPGEAVKYAHHGEGRKTGFSLLQREGKDTACHARWKSMCSCWCGCRWMIGIGHAVTLYCFRSKAFISVTWKASGLCCPCSQIEAICCC